VADRELLSELRAIAERSAKAADAGAPEAALLATYEALRDRAESLDLVDVSVSSSSYVED